MPRRNTRRNKTVQAIAAIKSEIHGRTLRLPGDPPRVNEQPKWPYTVVFRYEQVGDANYVQFSQAALFTKINALLNTVTPSNGSPYYFHVYLRSVKLWGGVGQSFRATVSNVFTGTGIVTLSDSGTDSRRPGVGYLFPSLIADSPLGFHRGSNPIGIVLARPSLSDHKVDIELHCNIMLTMGYNVGSEPSTAVVPDPEWTSTEDTWIE